jgi:glyoxylase-like metal-dependent hydrolase (beta-lactamase superfamily II)
MTARLPPGVTHVDCRTRDRPNVYLVDDGNLTLVDAGWPGDAATVRADVSDAGFDLADIDRVLLTHYDADHVGGLAQLTPELDAPVFVHELESGYVVGDDRPPWTARTGLEALHRLYSARLDLPDLPVRTVQDGDTIGDFRVHHTPGHTPGHVAYVHEGTRTAYLGDLAFGSGDGLRPSGRVTSYDAAQVRESIRALSHTLADVAFVCPGHGPPVAGGRDLLERALD